MKYSFSMSEDGQGQILLDIGGEVPVCITEADFGEISQAFSAFMWPVRQERFNAQQKAEAEEAEAARLARQFTINASGLTIRVQKDGRGMWADQPSRAWLDGLDEENSPFIIKRGFTVTRPWLILMAKGTGLHGGRTELCGENSNPIYFGSLEAAAKRVVSLGLHKMPETAGT
jgi:hypothetical protein